VQHECEPLGVCQGLEDHDQGEADRVGQQRVLVGVDVIVGAHEGSGRACFERLFGPQSPRAQHVQAHPPDHGGEPAAQVSILWGSDRASRTQASWTALSASLSELSIR
jgi:hypothetical protein